MTWLESYLVHNTFNFLFLYHKAFCANINSAEAKKYKGPKAYEILRRTEEIYLKKIRRTGRFLRENMSGYTFKVKHLKGRQHCFHLLH